MISSPLQILIVTEIISNIIESLIWFGPSNIPIALPATSIITKTLLALARTSKLTYPDAMKYLYGKCLYIDSPSRLSRLLETLNLHNSGASTLGSSLNVPLLHNISSLYLSAFENWHLTYRDLEQLGPICNLLALLAPTLKRLILNPRAGFRYDVYAALRPILSTLTSLEVFYSVTDGVGMFFRGEPIKNDTVWTHWPNLKVLVLNDVRPHLLHWKWWGDLECLERLILIQNPSPLDSNFQQDWNHWQASRKKEKMEVLLVGIERDRATLERGEQRWKEGDGLRMRRIHLHGETGGFFEWLFVGNWVMERLLEGNETLDDYKVE